MEQRQSREAVETTEEPLWGERLWVGVQVLALVAVLVSAGLSGRLTNREQRTLASAETDVVKIETYRPLSLESPSARPSTITSRVVVLPVPLDGNDVDRGFTIDVETRQFRFERPTAAEFGKAFSKIRAGVPQRMPAALKTWRLEGIEKKSRGNWEAVLLVRNDAAQTLGSVFVELSSGINEFRVLFVDENGAKLSYPVRVRHSRSS